ncbi:hypothetical protein CAI21_01150 [Alkalilimnicola ehrlichii]|uniref:Aminoglycoside phosphotransferase domain-containing protein n=2 Tax=Alkalilimnicola ehrlichii TaxID=351052 RepID=A0A3E0X527_9GAMM|nr:hypothetical protein CAI21_01150 [Alkalilimnicola ehrlichii]RFA39636.1 hypothetical protein CAL65_01265 [Alkalilimnicola ehrlichii]
MQRWLVEECGYAIDTLRPVSGDASFRRYFRASRGSASWVVMDAPPSHERCDEFVRIADCLRSMGLAAPEVLEADLARGFLLLSDQGDRQYLDALGAEPADDLYREALAALARLQTQGEALATTLPIYDESMLLREMRLFPDWLLTRHLGLELSSATTRMLETSFAHLVEVALSQPQVVVHRDYHSRNLMILPDGGPGVLDFQDAVRGPITYDLVSLLRDAYIDWPLERVEAWAVGYLDREGIRDLVGTVDREQWLYWFDLMGLQRHLKVSGIFARLWHRDGKARYLPDIPRVLAYLVQVSERYPQFAGLHRLLVEQVQPAMEAICEP